MAYKDGSYRVRLGTFALVDMTTTYEVTKFTVQSDQGHIRWLRPIDPSGALSEFAEITEALDGSKGGSGGVEVSWVFQPLTPKMVAYLRQTILNNRLSADVTILTWDRSTGLWQCINCLAQWNEPAKTAQPHGLKGYQQLRIDFVNGVIVDSIGDL